MGHRSGGGVNCTTITCNRGLLVGASHKTHQLVSAGKHRRLWGGDSVLNLHFRIRRSSDVSETGGKIIRLGGEPAKILSYAMHIRFTAGPPPPYLTLPC